jgi:small-conductance mechanosensitive channel
MKLPEAIEALNDGPVGRVTIFCVIVLGGFIAAKMSSRWVVQSLSGKLNPHQRMIAKKISYYMVLGPMILTALHGAGIDLSVLVGLAGVATVAIGLASQTVMSSFISGVFILIERPFVIGDTIRIGATTGEVVTMGVFSTTLSNSENMMVRIPNDVLMKSEIVNATRNSLRRQEILFTVAYDSDMAKTRAVVVKAIVELSITHETPAPTVIFKSFVDQSINLAIDFWVDIKNVREANFFAAEAVKKALGEASIKRV